MDLVALPCPAELVDPFLARVPAASFDALILAKQAPALTPLLRARGARTIHTIPEALYGRVSAPATRATLRRLGDARYDRAWFPVNNFGGNVALLLACVADEVTTLSATADPPLAEPLPDTPDSAALAAPPADAATLRALQDEVARRLRAPDPRLAALDGAERAGERPTHGLATGFPYDAEVLFRYVAAAALTGAALTDAALTDAPRRAGRFLELGAGLGYGAWVVAALARDGGGSPDVRAIDYDADAVALAAARFGDGARFAVGRAEDAPAGDASVGAVLCFEVLEHLAEPARLVREARRVLAPGGRFVGSTPDHRRYPYRVHDGRPGTPDELRAAGLWPWHVTALDEASLAALLAAEGFADPTFGYPTWVTGLRALPAVRAARDVDAALDVVADLTWTVADFALADAHVPVFSGFSFVFAATRPCAGEGTEA